MRSNYKSPLQKNKKPNKAQKSLPPKKKTNKTHVFSNSDLCSHVLV